LDSNDDDDDDDDNDDVAVAEATRAKPRIIVKHPTFIAPMMNE
jgi:hypothetical protein